MWGLEHIFSINSKGTQSVTQSHRHGQAAIDFSMYLNKIKLLTKNIDGIIIFKIFTIEECAGEGATVKSLFK